jgi:NAD(P) transhydrogenase subunit alpha
MSVTNAISSVIIVGALIAVAVSNSDSSSVSLWFGVIGIFLAAINIFGGFLVTQRMLAMYKKKKKGK